jgi:hypothetical protein
MRKRRRESPVRITIPAWRGGEKYARIVLWKNVTNGVDAAVI